MRAVGIMVHGGPEALEMLDVPEVHAGPGQIRIRNRASAVNPTDVIVRNGMRAELQKKDNLETLECQIQMDIERL